MQGIRQRVRTPVYNRQYGRLPGMSPHAPTRSAASLVGSSPSSSSTAAASPALPDEAAGPTTARSPSEAVAGDAGGEAGLKKTKQKKRKGSRGFEMSIARPQRA